MRRSGQNSVGAASDSALALCDGHGGVLAYGENSSFTFYLTCNDGRKCAGGAEASPVCDDSKAGVDKTVADAFAQAACEQTPGKVWSNGVCVDAPGGGLAGGLLTGINLGGPGGAAVFTKADCDKSKGVWNAPSQTCSHPSGSQSSGGGGSNTGVLVVGGLAGAALLYWLATRKK